MTGIANLFGGAALGIILLSAATAPSLASKLDGNNGPGPGATTATPPVTTANIDFGDDSSEWANDGECDDPRFTGTGSATELVEADLLKDATDCQAAFNAGTVTLIERETTLATPDTDSIDFGDDSSDWARDDECDDPRFTGAGMAANPIAVDILKDATDCRAALAAGTVTIAAAETAIAAADIDYGDDTSRWANDGECDDPRFSGTGVAAELEDVDLRKDATDCRASVTAGTATFNAAGDVATTAGTATPAVATTAFDYGGDFSAFANDEVCDDPRFYGEGVDKKLLIDDLGGDATDCQALEAAGKVTIRTIYTPAYAAAAPYDSSGVDFGDNTSVYADDEFCDDPRFEGPGAASTLLESDRLHDAVDCKTAYEAGTIMLVTDANGR